MNLSRKLMAVAFTALITLSAATTWAQETDCLDKKDNDGDGYADCADRDCQLNSQVCERREDWIESSEGQVTHVYPDTISVIAAIRRGDAKILLSKTDIDGSYTHSSTRLYQNLKHKGEIEATHYLVRDEKNEKYYNYLWTITDKNSGEVLETFMIETPIPVGQAKDLEDPETRRK